MNLFRCALPLLAAMLLVPAALAATPAAKAGMVVDVQGPARLVVDGHSKPLELLVYLPPDARIEVDAGARASVSLYASRSVFQLSGPAVADVGANGLVPVSGNAPVAQSLAQKLVASAQPGDRVHGAVRMRDASRSVALVTPKHGTVLLAAPEAFEWDAASSGPFTLTLYDEARPGTPLRVAQVEQDQWAPPADAGLVAGGRYSWTVAASGDDAGRAQGAFSLATPETAALLASITPAEDASVEEWVLYATALQEHGADEAARLVWRRIAERRPDLTRARFLGR